MRRTVVIEDTLLENAQRLLGTRGIRDTIEEALREVIRRNRLENLRNSLGTVELGLTSEDLTRLRDAEQPFPIGHVGLVRRAATGRNELEPSRPS